MQLAHACVPFSASSWWPCHVFLLQSHVLEQDWPLLHTEHFWQVLSLDNLSSLCTCAVLSHVLTVRLLWCTSGRVGVSYSNLQLTFLAFKAGEVQRQINKQTVPINGPVSLWTTVVRLNGGHCTCHILHSRQQETVCVTIPLVVTVCNRKSDDFCYQRSGIWLLQCCGSFVGCLLWAWQCWLLPSDNNSGRECSIQINM